MKTYLTTLWQCLSEPGEAMYRLGQRRPMAQAALTAALPGAIMCVITFATKGDQATPKMVALGSSVYVLTPLVFWLLGSAICHGIGRFIAGGEGEWQQMLVVYGFSYSVRLLEPVVQVVMRGSGQQLMWALYVWQGAIIVIGLHEVYGLPWMRSAATGVTNFLILAAAYLIGPYYMIPFFWVPPVKAEGEPFAQHLTTRNLVVNSSFEHTDDVYLLTPGEIAGWSGLCVELRAQTDKPGPSKRIWDLLAAPARQTMGSVTATAAVDDATAATLTTAFNGVLSRRDFYTKEDFGELTLPQSATDLIARGVDKLQDDDLMRLNRLLLPAAYPARVFPCSPQPRGYVKGWYPRVMALPGVKHGQDSEVSHSGQASVFVSKTGLPLGQPNLFAQQLPSVPKSAAIQVSAWIKTEDVTRSVFNLYVITEAEQLKEYHPEMLTGTHDWTECRVAAQLPDDVKFVLVGVGLWGKGTVWIDDVVVRADRPAPAMAPPPAPRRPRGQPKPATREGTAAP